MTTIDENTRNTALFVSSVLFRACLLGFGVLLLASIPTLLMTDQVYAIHHSIIEIPRPEYNALLFSWLGYLKLSVIVLFLLPAIAIRWALK